MPEENKGGGGSILGMIPAAVNAAAGVMGIGDKRQLRQQQKLTNQQVQAQMDLGEYNRQLQMQMWNDTNYGAQRKHLEDAGLNAALLYGKGGMGGMTTGGGMATGVGGGQAANAAQTSQASAGMGLMGAQIALMQAQTKKTEVEADKLAGVDTELAGADTGLKKQGTLESESRTEMNKIQAEIQKLDLELKGKSLEDQLYIIDQEAHAMTGKRMKAWAEGNIAENTQETQMKIINQELTNKALEAVAIQQGVNLDKARINEITNDIQRKWQELGMNTTGKRWEHEDRLTAIKEYTKTSLQTAGIIAAGNVVGDVVRIATRQMPKGQVKTTEDSKGGWKEEVTRPIP